MPNNNSFDDFDKIKDKASEIMQVLEFEKMESLETTKELALKEFEVIEKNAKKSAEAKIKAMDSVKNSTSYASNDFLQKWQNAFTETESGATDLAQAIADIFSQNDNTGNLLSKLPSNGLLEVVSDLFAGGFGGFFADGGRPPQNRVSLVGERGPELFVPDTAGTVLPNESLQNASATPIVVNQQFTFQSLDPVQNMKMLQAQKSQIQNWVVEGIKANQNGLRNVVESV